MQIKIDEVSRKLQNGFTHLGLDQTGAQMVTDALIDAELRGKKTHGISKAFVLEKAIKSREGKPEIIKDRGNYAFINAHKELGYISAKFAVNLLLSKAKEFDNAFVAMTNSYYYAMAGIYASDIAKEGYVGIVLNNGGPATVTPYGGIDPLFGTNPIAISIPTNNEPIVLDMTTAERPWGEVNLAKIEGRQLDKNIFMDASGTFTQDPAEVSAIIPFGGHKGYGINFMFEILTGALVSAKMGLQSQDGYDLGFLFIAISPDMFTSTDQFYKDVGILTNEIKTSRKAQGISEIFVPGEKSLRNRDRILKTGVLEIEESVWRNLCEFEVGTDIYSKVGLKQ